MRATWNGQIIAESDDTVVVGGRHYFPRSAIKTEFLSPSEKTSTCPLKGTANYFSVTVDGQEAPDSAWTYPNPKDDAVKDRIAFWNGVQVAHEGVAEVAK
jgi:uncharacterized protein (DUF427 family)